MNRKGVEEVLEGEHHTLLGLKGIYVDPLDLDVTLTELPQNTFK